MKDMLLNLFFMGICAIMMAITLNKVLKPKLPTALSVGCFVFLGVIQNYIWNYSVTVAALLPEFQLRMNLKFFTMTLIWVLYVLLAFKDSFKKKLFSFFAMIVSFIVAEFLAGALLSVVLDTTSEGVRDLLGWKQFFYYSLSVVAYLFAAVGTYAVCKRKELKISPPVAVTFGTIVFVNIAMIALVANSYSDNKDPFTSFILLFSPLLLIGLCIMLYRLLRQLNERDILKEKLFWIKNVNALELEYYNNLQQKSNDVRRIRHDFKDQMLSVRALIDESTNESLKKASEMLDSLDSTISATKLPIYTDNIIVNTIVGAKIEEAKKNGITVDCAIDLPCELPFENIDLNCVFLNLLNNSIEACQRLQQGQEKKIILKSGIKAGYLFIKTQNPCSDISKNDDGKFLTVKNDNKNHGLGMSIIEEIAKKYEGTLNCKVTDGIFESIVYVKLTA